MQRQIKKKQRHNFKVEPIFEQMSSYQLNAMEDDSDNQFTKATLFNSAKNIICFLLKTRTTDCAVMDYSVTTLTETTGDNENW